MKKFFVIMVMLLFNVSAVFAEDLHPGYRKAFGSGVIAATNGEYPPLSSFNASQFNFKNGAFNLKISNDVPVNLRAIPPAGKKWKDYYNQTIKSQKANLKYKKSDIFYWQIWTDKDSDGNPLDSKINPWPAKVGDIPNWEPLGWFTSGYNNESGEWDTIGVNADAFKADVFQYFFTAKPGQKFYITVSVGYSYLAGAGDIEQKWNSVLQKFESVESSGELGFSVSQPICGSTILVTENGMMD